MISKEIKYLVISDVHLGNKRNTTTEIINNLNVYFYEYSPYSQFTDLDIIFIAGDLFDTLLDFPNNDTIDIVIWLNKLIIFCYNYNIKLRILEGTPSHDWKQSKIAIALSTISNKPIDFKYIDILDIEHMSDLNLNILYLPDEWNSNSNKTYVEVQQILKEKHLDKVDIAIMHGAFQYQCNWSTYKTESIFHNEYNYLSIVNYFISVGHIHTFSIYDRIIAEGSFDRLSHNEEEPKGGVVFTIRPNMEMHYNFIENKAAKIFKTIEIKSNDTDKAIVKLDKAIAKLPNHSYVRIKVKNDNPLYSSLDFLKKRYLLYNISLKSSTDEEDIDIYAPSSINLDNNYIPITITKNNVIDLLLTEINIKHNLETTKIIKLTSLLESIL